MATSSDVNVTNVLDFIVARNLDVEGYYGIGILLMLWLIGFFVGMRFGFKRAFALSSLGITPIAIAMRFICTTLITRVQICLLSDSWMWRVIILAAIAGAMLFFIRD